MNRASDETHRAGRSGTGRSEDARKAESPCARTAVHATHGTAVARDAARPCERGDDLLRLLGGTGC